MKVELGLVEEGEVVRKVTNLLGINEKLMVHADPSGEMYFALSSNVRVLGEEFNPTDPEEVGRMLQMEDVSVYWNEKLIFQDPTWGQEMLNRIVLEVAPD